MSTKDLMARMGHDDRRAALIYQRATSDEDERTGCPHSSTSTATARGQWTTMTTARRNGRHVVGTLLSARNNLEMMKAQVERIMLLT
jgi:hypothetical protein